VKSKFVASLVLIGMPDNGFSQFNWYNYLVQYVTTLLASLYAAGLALGLWLKCDAQVGDRSHFRLHSYLNNGQNNCQGN
jgi:uncharacterized membrane protein YciS (DUF1049 family)